MNMSETSNPGKLEAFARVMTRAPKQTLEVFIARELEEAIRLTGIERIYRVAEAVSLLGEDEELMIIRNIAYSFSAALVRDEIVSIPFGFKAEEAGKYISPWLKSERLQVVHEPGVKIEGAANPAGKLYTARQYVSVHTFREIEGQFISWALPLLAKRERTVLESVQPYVLDRNPVVQNK